MVATDSDRSKEFQKIIQNPEIAIIKSVFESNGYELRIVGGAVRDLLVGHVPNDIDFATNATPKQIADILELNIDDLLNTIKY